MTGHADQLERRLFRQYWDDGLLDVLSGVGALAVGLSWAVDLVALGAAVPAVLAALWVPLRRRLVEPRAGLVEFADQRVERNRRGLVGSALLGLAALAAFAALAFWAAPNPGGPWRAMAPALPALLLGLLAVVAGLILGLPRFVVYAGLFSVAGLGVAATDSRPEVAILAAGLLVLASGAWRMNRFLRLEAES
jgi:predicted small integral membrane protein